MVRRRVKGRRLEQDLVRHNIGDDVTRRRRYDETTLPRDDCRMMVHILYE